MDTTRDARPGRAAGWWGAALGCGLLLLNTCGARGCAPLLSSAPPGYRYWEDVRYAAHRFLDEAGAAPDGASAGSWPERVAGEAEREGIQPWQFWRTLPEAPLRAAFDGPSPLGPGQDVGRSRLLVAGFRLLGGVAPFLGLWLGALLSLPVIVWAAVELDRAGWRRAALVFPLLFASSAFVIDGLSLAYSAFGFYLGAALMLVPLAAYATGPRVSPRGLLARAAVAGAMAAGAATCRGGVMLLLPGLLAAGLWGALRVARPLAQRAALWVALAVAVAAPSAVRPSQGHDVWIAMWEGLGDFDRTRGHAWSDAAAKRALAPDGITDLRSSEAEAALRRKTLAHISEDPGWYAAILTKRVLATVAQWKLWPWAPLSRHSQRPASHPNEGAIDGYYGLATAVDHFRLGPWVIEAPMLLLLAPSTVLLARWGRGRLGGRTGGREGAALCLLMPVGLGLIAAPVVVSTASALETQAFALAHLLAAALLFDRTARPVVVSAAGDTPGAAGPPPTRSGAGSAAVRPPPPRTASPQAGPGRRRPRPAPGP